MALRESQKRASLKWDKENMTVLSCKMKKEQAVAFRSYCEGRGKKSNTVLKDYVLSCIEERDSGGNLTESPWKGLEGPQGVEGIPVPSDVLEDAQRAADAAGESVGDFMRRAVDAQAQRDEVSRRLKI